MGLAGGFARQGRTVRGWVAGLEAPAAVEFFLAGEPAGTAAVRPQADGAARFEFLLPAADPGALTARVQNVWLESPRPEGRIDLITDENIALGWAWNAAMPEQRVDVAFFVDGVAAGSCRAEAYRPDIEAAGHGDGRYAFAWPIPYFILAGAREFVLEARDAATGTALGEPKIVRQQNFGGALARIAVLEAEILGLRRQVAEADEARLKQLFTVMGEFFQEVARQPGPPVMLGEAVREASKAAGFDLPECAAPEITVCISAAGAPADMLRQLAAQAGSAKVAFCLLNEGRGEAAALAPLAFRNLHYVHAPGATPAARINAAMQGRSGVMVFLGAGIALEPGWPTALENFAQHRQAAALAGRVTGAEGFLREAGAAFFAGVLHPRGFGLAADTLDFRYAGTVEAVGEMLFALRADVFAKIGGLDAGFSGLGPALAEYCQRATQAGWEIAYAPGFSGVLSGATAQVEDISAGQADARRLGDILARPR